MSSTDLWAEMRRMAARPNGVRPADLPLDQRHRAANACVAMTRKGQLFKLKISHRVARYFASQQLLDAYVARVRPPVTKRRNAFITRPAAGKGPAGDGREAVLLPGVEVQVCPAYKPRNVAITFSFIHRSGSCGTPGFTSAWCATPSSLRTGKAAGCGKGR